MMPGVDSGTVIRQGSLLVAAQRLLARRLVEAGTRVVEVVWPKVANSDNHSWDVHRGLTKRMRDQSSPMLDAGLSALISDLDDRGLLDRDLEQSAIGGVHRGGPQLLGIHLAEAFEPA